MENITTKFCKKCNENKNTYLFGYSSKNKDGFSFYCKDCNNIIFREIKTRPEQRENHRLYSIEYRKNNPEKSKLSDKKYRQKEEVKVKRKTQSNMYQENLRNELGDLYVKQQLKSIGFKNEQITPQLIELKRITLKTKRLCHQLKN